MLSELDRKRAGVSELISGLLNCCLIAGLFLTSASLAIAGEDDIFGADDPFGDAAQATPAGGFGGDDDDIFGDEDGFGDDDIFGESNSEDAGEFDPFGGDDQPPKKTHKAKATKPVKPSAKGKTQQTLAHRLKKLGYHGIGDETESEVRIMETLEQETSLVFQLGDPLSQVAAVISERHSLPFHFDVSALEDESIDPASDGVLDFKAKKIKLNNALALILDPLDLTYIIRNEVLMITSKTQAESTLTTKMYRMTDRWEVDERDFADTIRQMVQPDSWDEVGGPGAIKVVSGAIFVSNAAAVHRDIEKLCAKFDILYP